MQSAQTAKHTHQSRMNKNAGRAREHGTSKSEKNPPPAYAQYAGFFLFSSAGRLKIAAHMQLPRVAREQMCLCSALPAEALQTSTRFVILQHPAETKRWVRRYCRFACRVAGNSVAPPPSPLPLLSFPILSALPPKHDKRGESIRQAGHTYVAAPFS